MADFELIITEVTEKGSFYCLAGWCPIRKRMVRPLSYGEYWSSQQLQFPKSGTYVRPGHKVRFSATESRATGDFPHQTENIIVDRQIRGIIDDPSFSWFGDGAPDTVENLQDAFSGYLKNENLRNGVFKRNFVPAGSISRSLWGLSLKPSSFQFREDLNFTGKKQLRAEINDMNGCYSLPVVAKDLLENYRSAGINAIPPLLPLKGKLHIRVGLAQPFDNQPDKCYLMINGVNW